MTSVLFPLALLGILSIGHYLHKREDSFILFRRIVGALPCVGIPVYFMFEGPYGLSGWMIVTFTAAALLLYNFLFSTTLRHLSGKVDEHKVYEKLKERAEQLAKEIVEQRDAQEFHRLRQELLARKVAEEFEARLNRATEAGASEKVAAELREVVRGTDLKYAIWVGLYKAEEVFGCDLPSNQVLAIPYWVDYRLHEGEKVRVLRFNTCQATRKPLNEVSFMSKRWSKVEDQRSIVVDGALVTGVA